MYVDFGVCPGVGGVLPREKANVRTISDLNVFSSIFGLYYQYYQ